MFVVLVFVCGMHGIRHECKLTMSVAGVCCTLSTLLSNAMMCSSPAHSRKKNVVDYLLS